MKTNPDSRRSAVTKGGSYGLLLPRAPGTILWGLLVSRKGRASDAGLKYSVWRCERWALGRRGERAECQGLSFAEFVQLTLILHQLRICKFAYSPKFISSPKSLSVAPLGSFPNTVQIGEKPELPGVHVPHWGHTRGHTVILCLQVPVLAVSMCPLCSVFSVTLFTFCASCWWFHCVNGPHTWCWGAA